MDSKSSHDHEAVREALHRYLTFKRYWHELQPDNKVLSSNANLKSLGYFAVHRVN
jgi:hypothetical protein